MATAEKSGRRRRGWLGQAWEWHVAGPVRDIEKASLAGSQQRAEALDKRTLAVCVVAAIMLTFLHYFGLAHRMGWLNGFSSSVGLPGFGEWFEQTFRDGPGARLHASFYWAGACLLFYFAVPALVVKLGLRQSLSEMGLRWRGALHHWRLYLILYALVMPVVVAASFTAGFQDKYPMYRVAENRIPDGFLLWEVAYAGQFFALEFFFRGFLIHGLKHRFGAYAVAVAIVPYCMIHFGKPLPETLAAIGAGAILGFVSLRTGTIWLGFLVHVSVALSMDVLALWQRGLL